tara:strand:+ start:68 stop:1102 length:1035 start_codon:yes stop_codon:yes gene_type:complete
MPVTAESLEAQFANGAEFDVITTDDFLSWLEDLGLGERLPDFGGGGSALDPAAVAAAVATAQAIMAGDVPVEELDEAIASLAPGEGFYPSSAVAGDVPVEDGGYDFHRLELQEWIDAVMADLESLSDEEKVDYLHGLQQVDEDGWAIIVHEGLDYRTPPTVPPTTVPPPTIPTTTTSPPGGPIVKGPPPTMPPDDEVNTLPLTPVPTPTTTVPPPTEPFSPEEIHDPTGPGTVTVPPPFSPEEIRDPGGPGTVTVPEPPNQGWFPDILGEGMTPPSYTPGTGPIEQIPTPQSPHEEESPFNRGFMNSLAQQTQPKSSFTDFNPATQQQLEQWKKFSMAQMPRGR